MNKLITCDKEFIFSGGKSTPEKWRKCKVIFKGDRYTILLGEGGKEYCRPNKSVKFRDL